MSKKDVYLIVSSGDDGTSVQLNSKEELLDYLKEHCDEPSYGGPPEFVDEHDFDEESDPSYWNQGVMMIVKGEIVIPRATKTKGVYEVD